MNLFVLDTNLDTVIIIDNYKSLLWNDRFREYGDFELMISPNEEILECVKMDYYIWSSHSEKVMIVEDININTDSENGDEVKIVGRSLESILSRRIIWGLRTVSGNFQSEMKAIINENIINPSKPERKIDNFIFMDSDDERITSLTIESQYSGDNIYDVIKDKCEEHDIGFSVTINDQKQFVFQFYAGVDRSYNQTFNPWVIFSPNFNNLLSSEYSSSMTDVRNVTLVGGEGEGTSRRYTAVGNYTGLNRREVFTDASGISSKIDDNITESFGFSQYPHEAFHNTNKTFITEANDPNNPHPEVIYFDSCMVNIEAYAGTRINLTIPKFTSSNGQTSKYAVILVDESKNYISTLKAFEKIEEDEDQVESWTSPTEEDPYNEGDVVMYNGRKYESLIDNNLYSPSSSPSSWKPVCKGELESYELYLPEDAKYIYTSMYSQKAIDDDVYSGDLDSFECVVVKMSDGDYIRLMREAGKDNLTFYEDSISFDGEIEPNVSFIYGRDFLIGDIVQVENEYGSRITSRVMELILSDDESGTALYPTFDSIIPEEPSEILPEGYTSCNYIRSNGNQYINTFFTPNDDTRIVIDIEPVGTSIAAFFGTRDKMGGEAMFALWYLDADEARYDYGSDSVSEQDGSLNMNGRITITANREVCTIGNVTITGTKKTFDCVNNLMLLTAITDGEIDTRKMSAKIYSCRIYDDETLVRNFIPCKNPSSLLGLYDTIEGKFYANFGTGEFTTE